MGATLSALVPDGVDALALHWDVMEQRCAEFGHVADRSRWRLVGPMNVAETREKAREQVRYGIDAWFDYVQNVQAAAHFTVAGETTDKRIDFVVESGMGVIGTPADAVEQIARLREQSRGGFGADLLMTHEWAPWHETLRSHELIAESVFPAFQGSTGTLLDSVAWARGSRADLAGAQMTSVQNAVDKHAAQVAAREAVSAG